ncbi:unnamed protein product [Symbiodinium sp. CCMP2592]|nr:unnamed protein product [Symbiodinium sp. CCMP2592]
MKRTADEAAISVMPQRVRVNIVVPPDPITAFREITFDLECDASFTIDSVKWALIDKMYAVLGRNPRISSFQLHQDGRHVEYTQPITVLSTLSRVRFVRTAPDQWE